MPTYRIIYSYLRFFNSELNLDLEQKDNWDGEEMVFVDTDIPIGEGAEGVENDLKYLSKTLAETKGYEAVVLTSIHEVIDEDESGDEDVNGE